MPVSICLRREIISPVITGTGLLRPGLINWRALRPARAAGSNCPHQDQYPQCVRAARAPGMAPPVQEVGSRMHAIKKIPHRRAIRRGKARLERVARGKKSTPAAPAPHRGG